MLSHPADLPLTLWKKSFAVRLLRSNHKWTWRWKKAQHCFQVLICQKLSKQVNIHCNYVFHLLKHIYLPKYSLGGNVQGVGLYQALLVFSCFTFSAEANIHSQFGLNFAAVQWQQFGWWVQIQGRSRSRGSEEGCRGRAGGLFRAKVDRRELRAMVWVRFCPGKKVLVTRCCCSATLWQAMRPLLGAKVTSRALES